MKYYYKTPSLLFLVVFTIILLFTNHLSAKPAIVVARVNNQIITLTGLENRVDFSKKYSLTNTRLGKKSLIYNTLDEMIEESMINQEAKRVGISISEPELKKIMLQIKEGNSKIYRKLRSSLATKTLEDKVRASLIWSKILSELVKPSIRNINKPQIIETLEELDKDTSEFKFNISQIKIKKSGNAKLIIEKVYKELIDSDETQEALELYKEQGILFDFSDIGWVSKSTLDKEIYETLILDKNKGYSRPVTLENEYVIFKINTKMLSNNISDKDYRIAQNKIYQSLKISDGKGFLRNLRKRTFVEIYHSRINKYMGL